MNSKRIRWLAMLAALLLIANIATRFGGDEQREFGWSADNRPSLKEPKVARTLDQLTNHTLLQFKDAQVEQTHEQQGRNPFEFGVDRKLAQQRAQQQESMRQLAAMEAIIQDASQADESVEERAVFDGIVLGVFQDTEDGSRRVALKHDDIVWVLGSGERIKNLYEVRAISDRQVIMIHLAQDEEITISYAEESPAGRW